VDTELLVGSSVPPAPGIDLPSVAAGGISAEKSHAWSGESPSYIICLFSLAAFGILCLGL
jgi:hypothetical protein